MFACCLQMIDKYLQNTHAATHSLYKMRIQQVFKCSKHGEKERFRDVGNRFVETENCDLVIDRSIHLLQNNDVPFMSAGFFFGMGLD